MMWLTACALLAGCAEKPGPASSPGEPVFSADLAGAAKRCDAPSPSLSDGRPTAATMRVGNDGGWCAISVRRDGKPYAAGLLVRAPEHGGVFIHPVGSNTRIDYTPEPGFAGADSFVVQLIPGDPEIRATVTVTR